jgi:hypothetical protein
LKKLRVAWISTAALDKTPRGLTSDQASMRYRMLIPSAALQALGCESSVLYAAPAANRRAILSRLEGVDAVVIAKVFIDATRLDQEAPGLLQLVAEIGARGIKVLADFSDNTFVHPRRGPVDRSLANLVDLVVASTPELAQLLRQETPMPVVSVTDPVEGERGEPRVPVQARPPAAPLALVWFGHWTNFRTLELAWQQLAPLAAERPLSMVILSRPGGGHEEAVARVDAEWRKTGSACRFRSWSAAAVFEALRECDAVVIPSDPQNPEKSIKSPNRFCESVWAGRFVVAHPLPSYQLLAAGGWVGADLAEGLRWMLAQPDAALARIRAGQSAVAASHSPEVIGQAWKRAIEAALG